MNNQTIGDFRIGKTIGSGTFGKVKEGIHLPTGSKVAIKVLEKGKIHNQEDLQRISQELKILRKVEHPNIIQLLELHQNEDSIYIVTQMVEGKELYERIVAEQSLGEKDCGALFCQLLDAVSFLHSKGICHRDIKPENIIIDNNGFLKLIDFGLSKEFDRTGCLQTSCGSPCYAAPEMLKSKRYNASKVDIWALGVTLHAMAVGRLPFEEENTERLYKNIQTQVFRCSRDVPESMRSLIEAMVEKEPKKRATLKEIKDHLWFKKHRSSIPQAEYDKDDLILDSMSKIFNHSPVEISRIVSNKEIPSIFTYYFLVRTKKLVVKEDYRKNDEYEIHQGPFHLNYCFENREKLEEFVRNMEGEISLGKNKFTFKGIEVKVKKIKGTQMLYANFPPYYMEIEDEMI